VNVVANAQRRPDRADLDARRADDRPTQEVPPAMTSINGYTPSSTAAASAAPAHRHHVEGTMTKVAGALGMSKDDLKTQLKSGKSLNDIATAQGVSHDDLITAIKAGMPKGADGTDATAMAEKIAGTQGMPKPPAGGHGPGHPKGMNGALQDSTKLAGISKLLDTSSADVTSSATTASDLVKMLQSKGVDLNALSKLLDSGDLVDVSA
jgi:hypothetical protein